MQEYIRAISMIVFSILSVYLLSRIRLIPANKIGMIERYGVYFKPISQGVHFLIPFVDRLVIYDINRELHLNREIIEVKGEPKLSFSLNINYRIVDERDYHENNVDQFMKEVLVEGIKTYTGCYGTQGLSQQKVALQARLKGAMMEKVVEWGIELKSLELLAIIEVPSYSKYSNL